MFCYIKYAEWEGGKCDEGSLHRLGPGSIRSLIMKNTLQENKTLLINPNCYIRILIDYIAEIVKFDFKSASFDLCNENGELLRVDEMEPCESATKVLMFQKTYIVVKCFRNDDGIIKSLEPLLYKNSREYFDVKSRLKKYISSSTKKMSDKKKRNSDEIMKFNRTRRRSDEESLCRASSSRSSRRTLQSSGSSKNVFLGKTSSSAH
ncbi:hypothetical protein Trydic_g7558 [Trypoxylus dichotomus]